MSKDSLEHLRAVFGPKVFALDVDELAQVLGKATRGAKDHLRERIKNGDIPRAQKVNGRWKVPVDVVAEILEPTPAPQPAPVLPRGGFPARRHSILGDRITFVRACEFWGYVCVALGWFAELKELTRFSNAAREELFELHARAMRERLEARLVHAEKQGGGKKPI